MAYFPLPQSECSCASSFFNFSGRDRRGGKNERKRMKALKKIWNAVTTVIVILAVLLAVLLVGVRLIGLRTYTVLSGSMEPKYHTGSLIYVKSADPLTLEAGDDITFMLDEDTVATHRIIEVLPDEADETVVRFRTQGIANDVPDGGTVHCRNVIGTPVFTVPYLGYVANYIQAPPGKYVAISAGALLLALVFIPDLFADEKKEKDGKEKATAENPPEA